MEIGIETGLLLETLLKESHRLVTRQNRGYGIAMDKKPCLKDLPFRHG
jgi:hypothetical protein